MRFEFQSNMIEKDVSVVNMIFSFINEVYICVCFCHAVKKWIIIPCIQKIENIYLDENERMKKQKVICSHTEEIFIIIYYVIAFVLITHIGDGLAICVRKAFNIYLDENERIKKQKSAAHIRRKYS